MKGSPVRVRASASLNQAVCAVERALPVSAKAAPNRWTQLGLFALCSMARVWPAANPQSIAVDGDWMSQEAAARAGRCQDVAREGVSAPLEAGLRDAESPVSRAFVQQGRQDSNLQPPVLETGALPIAPRPWAACGVYPRRPVTLFPLSMQRYALAGLFSAIAVSLALVAAWAALSGGRAWVVALGAGAIALWMGDMARRIWPR